MKKFLAFLFLLCTILTAMFIYLQSDQDATQSGGASLDISGPVADATVPDMDSKPPAEQTAIRARIDRVIRKLAHMAEYAALGFFLILFMLCGFYSHTDSALSRLTMFSVSVLICLLYGVSDEIHQLFVPGRSCQLTDMLIDGAGGLLGTLIGYVSFYIVEFMKKKEK